MNKRTQIDETLTLIMDPECYTVNTRCSEELVQAIHAVQDKFIERFGDAVFCPRGADLHATLLDWLNPFVHYSKDKGILFDEMRDSWEEVTRKVLETFAPVEVRFGKLAYRKKVICLEGFDNGELNKMRESLNQKGFLPLTNKVPPADIHITVVAFREELDEGEVQDLFAEDEISIYEHVRAFRLVYSPKARLQDHVEIALFELNGNSSELRVT